MSNHSLEIVAHILRGNSDRFYPVGCDPLVAASIGLRGRFELVNQPVDLDGDRGRFAIEV